MNDLNLCLLLIAWADSYKPSSCLEHSMTWIPNHPFRSPIKTIYLGRGGDRTFCANAEISTAFDKYWQTDHIWRGSFGVAGPWPWNTKGASNEPCGRRAECVALPIWDPWLPGMVYFVVKPVAGKERTGKMYIWSIFILIENNQGQNPLRLSAAFAWRVKREMH